MRLYSTPDASETTLQHSHSENCAKKQSAKHKNYYERHKVRILSNRKQQYQKNVDVERAASCVRAKVNYKRKPQAKKDPARVASKVKYARTPEPKKDAAHVVSKLKYAKNPKVKIRHSKKYYANNKQSICAKRDKYSLCKPKLAKIEMYLQEIEANLNKELEKRIWRLVQ